MIDRMQETSQRSLIAISNNNMSDTEVTRLNSLREIDPLHRDRFIEHAITSLIKRNTLSSIQSVIQQQI